MFVDQPVALPGTAKKVVVNLQLFRFTNTKTNMKIMICLLTDLINCNSVCKGSATYWVKSRATAQN